MASITFKGVTTLNLIGNEVAVGAPAPDFTLRKGLAPDSAYTLDTDAGKVRLLSVVPSLDTPVCDTQTRTFNQRAAELGNVVIVTVSLDLPTAQGRWCGAAGVDKVITASDYFDHSFGQAYGVRIEALGVLARALFVIDGNGTLTYKQIVPELTNEPNYDEAITAAKAAIA